MKNILLIILLTCCSLSSFSQWTDQNSGTTNDLNDVHFVSNTTGWVVGRSGTVVTTSNGGQAWIAQNSSTSKDLNDVFMVNGNTGYAVGDNGTVIKFSNGSWTSLSSGTTRDLFGVHFIDENTGWICGDWGQIRKTTNGGSSWNEENNHTTHSNLFNDIFMLNATTGWAVGTSGKIVQYNGTNWVSQSSGQTTELLGVHFRNTSMGFAVGKSSKILFYNGSSWSEHNSGLNSYNIHNVCFADDNTAYASTSDAFGGKGIILKYDGNTWSKDYEYSGIGTEIFYGIHFPSSARGIVVGTGGLVKSKGSGAPTSLKEFAFPGSSGIYPNPFNTRISINFTMENTGHVQAEIISLHGQVMSSQETFGQSETPNEMVFGNLDQLPGGIYILRVTCDDKTYTQKLLKQ